MHGADTCAWPRGIMHYNAAVCRAPACMSAGGPALGSDYPSTISLPIFIYNIPIFQGYSDAGIEKIVPRARGRTVRRRQATLASGRWPTKSPHYLLCSVESWAIRQIKLGYAQFSQGCPTRRDGANAPVLSLSPVPARLFIRTYLTQYFCVCERRGDWYVSQLMTLFAFPEACPPGCQRRLPHSPSSLLLI